MAWGTPNRERRVLKAGHSSIAVTLPKPWAEAMNLRPGDLVVFDQNDDGTLYLKPAPAPGAVSGGSPFSVQAHSFETPGVLERLVVGAYRVGHDAIEIRTDVPLGPDRVEELLQAARNLLGVSVVAQEPNRVVLQNFIDPSKYGLPQLVQRMKMILVAFLDETEEVLKRRQRSRRLPTLEEEAGKVLALLVRQLFLASRDWSLARRIGSPDPRQLLEWRVVVHSLEELAELFGEALTLLNDDPSGLPVENTEALAGAIPDLTLHLKAVMEALMHPSLDNACGVYHESADVGMGQPALTRSLARKSPSVRAAHDLFKRGTRCLSLLAEVAIDRAVASGSETILVEAA
ncbi:MAG TPA: AbrB/MazE/SpoVT family DNA-binding domain-containing protein [Thermoplasmata archaeon]|nr:AbrB/MazE/SpoVT family DNA-binding domain-containing protein [Thermoplasmata archaeon]HYB78256.1 AbrB/MazE/SpoVT family DNA-binding domain-containing protein [Thermoplasmata archaeon]